MATGSERERLLNLVIDLILERGMIDVSLSAIAREVGSNNRMLLYYFGSREALLDEASLKAFDRFPRLRDLFVRLNEPGDLYDRLVRAWDDLSHPDNLEFLRLYFQRFGVAMREPGKWQGFTERAGQQWVSEVTKVFEAEGFGHGDAHSGAIQVVGLWRGLQVLLLSGVPHAQLRLPYQEGVRAVVSSSAPH